MIDVAALVSWLEAQIAEDEKRWRELLVGAQQVSLELKEPKLLGRHIPGWWRWPDVEQMCEVALRDVEVKRRIIADFTALVEEWNGEPADAMVLKFVARSVLLPLAESHRDRDGFDPSWLPKEAL